jgi:light-regulated signal transduction histidine kinase (bacteriophytochrome)
MLKTKHSGELKTDARNYLDIMQRNTRKMDVLISELLDLSRLGRQEIHVERLNMKELAKMVANDTLMINPTRKVELIFKDLPLASGDAGMMNHVWMNLIGNAFKYTRDRENAQIEIGGYEDHDRLVYYVKDNGVGFDMKEYGRLFRAFQRLHSISEFDGSGIGLAIVQRVIAKHNGVVWAESTLGEGATFYFCLPNLEFFKDKKV